jgi:hypothetical protein
MATVYSEAFDDARPVERPAAAAIPRRRRRLWIVLAPVLLVLALPSIISYTNLRHRVLRMAVEVDGKIRCESMSLGWFTSQSVGGLSIVDKDGKPLLTETHVELPKSLLSLALSPGDLGTIKISHAQLDLVLRADGSNLEEVLAKLLKPNEPPGKPVSGTIELANVTATIVDEVKQRQWKVTALGGSVQLSPDASTAVKGVLNAQLAADPDTPRLACEFTIPKTDVAAGGADAAALPSQASVVLKTERFPLDLCEPIVRRWDEKFVLSGRLTTDMAAEWPMGSQSGVIAVRGQQSI